MPDPRLLEGIVLFWNMSLWATVALSKDSCIRGCQLLGTSQPQGNYSDGCENYRVASSGILENVGESHFVFRLLQVGATYVGFHSPGSNLEHLLIRTGRIMDASTLSCLYVFNLQPEFSS
uniref:Uncharacterized protein n=1 Tax=Physcomitrium patens TaxID=3218 RepID=A0A2K1IWV3_PHYPA|nr:hypothetical protein PHYPA_023576 [Physcomitrium patens]